MNVTLPVALGLLFIPLAAAQAAFIPPSLGVASTLAEVGSQFNYTTFTVDSSVGTPGTIVPNYSPKAFTGPTRSSINATVFTQGAASTFETSTGLASANLASGQLKVGAGSIYDRLHNQDLSAGTAAQAAFSDVLTFGGAITTPVTVELTMTVDGSITASGLGAYPVPNDNNSDIATFALSTNQGLAEVFIGHLRGDSVDIQDESGTNPRAHVTVLSGSASALRLALTYDLTITDTNRTVLFQASALAEPIAPTSYGAITSDFEHTAALSLALPAGLTFTSLSGVFLTEPQDGDGPTGGTTVPEPAGALPLLIGLAALVSARRRPDRLKAA